MQVTRKIAAAAAVATVATLGLATVVSANMIDDTKANSGLADTVSSASKGYGDKGGHKWYGVDRDGGLLAIDDNKVGPFQACDNFIPVNAVGVQVPVKDIVGIVGFDQNGNSATAVKTCEQEVGQNDHHGKWYRAGDDGLISVSDNKVGPFQACHNDIPINAVGVQVPVSDLTGLLGLDQNANAVESLKTCEQEVGQNN
ncbi:hypothetical protein [Kribbella italica]|uniref:Secreted protein n=1 Tax=Kribbella italica TaxID=1540520 RepID=A0A7W9JBP6_9ACTN|nr:hypothetical protein [Kribbella italica]MBB5839004.1 hypothetical protein [Kribbella italica]